jgi:hypothetical protein
MENERPATEKSPPATEKSPTLRPARGARRAALTLTDTQRAALIASIDRQIAEIDKRKNDKDA